MAREDPFVAVVGGINMDIGAKPDHPLLERDSNPGRIRLSPGGVGHNIARNQAQLGLRTVFLTALGQDAFGARLEADCRDAGIDMSLALRSPEEPSSAYLFIADEKGDMRLAVSDMAICQRLTPGFVEARLPLLNRAAAVVLDANLPAETIRFLAESCTAPLFADPVSVAKSEKLRPVLGKLRAFKPNRLEAELMTGLPTRTEPELAAAAEALLKTGLGEVYISLGGDGVFAAEPGRHLWIPCFPARPRNMTGAGDAFVAGLVWSHLRGGDLAEKARAASAAASIAVEAPGAIHPDLNPETLAARLRARPD